MTRLSRSARVAIVAAIGVAGILGVRRTLVASDHQDTADVELNPTQDMTDFYAFPGSTPDRIAIVLNSQPFITPANAGSASFDPNLLYQIKVDNTGDAVEDKVIEITFTGTGPTQQVQVRGPLTPSVTGAMENVVSTTTAAVSGAINMTLGSAAEMQVYAGVRDDPFFLDLEQFFRILPDRKPATGALSQLSSAPSASAFRPVAQAVNYLTGFNVASIVIELPTAMLTAGGTAKLGLWGTISR